jgi:hypothetical protein
LKESTGLALGTYSKNKVNPSLVLVIKISLKESTGLPLGIYSENKVNSSPAVRFFSGCKVYQRKAKNLILEKMFVLSFNIPIKIFSIMTFIYLKQRYNTQDNDIQHNDTQHNGLVCNTQHK